MKRPGKGRKLGKVAEPVDHFEEWTTSWGGEAGKGPETWESSRASGPLARAERLEKGWKLGKEAEPVVHFVEWTTSWVGKAGKWPVSGGVAEAPSRAGGLTSSGLSSYTDKVTNQAT